MTHENLLAMYIPLDSHDTERFKTMMAGNIDKLKDGIPIPDGFSGSTGHILRRRGGYGRRERP